MPERTASEILEHVRQEATRLRAELAPLMKDTPTPGGLQKVARRASATLELVGELCELLERHVLKLDGRP
jgi:hypothetical protein